MSHPEERMIDKIQKLLDRASHSNTPAPEAETALRMADELMIKYSIDQAILMAGKSKEERERPERRDVELFEPYHRLRGPLAEILTQLSNLADVRAVRIEGGKHALVGYAADIDYLEMLFISVRNQFQQRMFPKWDPNKGLDENIYNFKVAGYKWIEIWLRGAEAHSTPMPFSQPPKDGGAMIRAYKRHAKIVGDNRKISTQRFDAYRNSYAAGFVNTIQDRVERMTADRRSTEHSSGSGAEVALRDRRRDVLEELWVHFPDMRPLSPEERRAESERLAAERDRKEREHQEWLNSLTPKQRDVYDRKQEAEQRANQRWWDEYHRRNRTDVQGYGAGSRAASQADLSGGRNNLGRTKEIG